MKKRHSAENKEFNPETLALGYGYDPRWSEGAVKPPIFLTSTFQFASAEDGKHFFELAYGLKEKKVGEVPGLIYSRLNNPNLQIFEERIAAWDKTDQAAVFSSGMAAISTTMLSLLEPGDHVISSAPVYGGTHYLLEKILPTFNISSTQVLAGDDTPEHIMKVAQQVGLEKVKLVFLETPANPSNALIDIAAVSDVTREIGKISGRQVVLCVDNTFLGPVFQRPAMFGADLVLYSATKFIGGHSDLIAGVVSGSEELLAKINVFRTILGTMSTPFGGWLLLRSLETLSIRMRQQSKNARKLAQLLENHPKVTHVRFPGLLKKGSQQSEVFRRQCTGPGSLIAFEVEGGEEAAFKVLNSFEVFRLAVSLGGTESLVEHPMSMTHSDVEPGQLESFGVTAGLIRMSVGIEHLSDLRRDLLYALSQL